MIKTQTKSPYSGRYHKVINGTCIGKHSKPYPDIKIVSWSEAYPDKKPITEAENE